jgi:hypothetical protein
MSTLMAAALPVVLGSLLTVLGTLIAVIVNQRFADRQQKRQVELQRITNEQRLRNEKAARVRHALGKVIEAAHIIEDAVAEGMTPGGPAGADRLETFWADADARATEARSELLLEADGETIVDLYDNRLRKAFVSYSRSLREQASSEDEKLVARRRSAVIRATLVLVEQARAYLARVEGEEIPVDDDTPTVVRVLARAKL